MRKNKVMSSAPSPPLLPFEALSARLAALLAPAARETVACEQALGRIAAGVTRTPLPLPPTAIAQADGYAVAALDLAGASALSPVYLPSPPPFVGAGESLPQGADAILPPQLLDGAAPFATAYGEVFPAEGIWRRGEWLAQDELICPAGQKITPLHLDLARAAGLETITVLAPIVRLIDISASERLGPNCLLLQGWLEAQGLRTIAYGSGGREKDRIIAALRDHPDLPHADLTLLVGGTGESRDDQSRAALAALGPLISCGAGINGLACLVAAECEGRPVLALPASLAPLMLASLALLQPMLDRILTRARRPNVPRPLLRKLTSPVGQAELLLLAQDPAGWQVLNTAPPSPMLFLRADAYHIIASGSEGYAPDTVIEATLCQGWTPL